MKTFSFVGIFLLLCVSISSSQWEKVKNIPPPYHNSYWLEIYFLPNNPNYGWVCGYDGRVLRTTDGGKTWQGTTIRGAYQLEHIHFADEKYGYTSGIGTDGLGKIYKTTDGGMTWFNITPNRAEDLWGNWFVDRDYGIVVGGGCITPQRFFVTTNGGMSWDYMYEVDWFPNSGLTDVILYSRNGLGYATSSGYIWKTTDGGKSWTLFSRSGDNDWQEDLWINGNTIIVPYSTGCGGEGGTGGVRFSKDLGKTWKQFPTGTSMFGAFLHDPLRGWVCGWNRAVYYTSDGGDTWTLMNCGIDADVSLDDFWFVNDTLGWVVGKGIYKFVGIKKVVSKIQVLPDSIACEGDTIILRAANDAKFYSWSNNAVSREIKATKSGVYELISWDSDCDSIVPASVRITFHPKPVVKLSLQGRIPLCEGDTIPLWVANPNGTILWSNGSSNDTIFVYEPKRFVAYVTNQFGCKDSAFVEFYLVPRPKIQVTGRLGICDGDSVILNIPGNNLQVEWFRDSDANVIYRGNRFVVYKTGRYFAKIQTQEGCSFVSDTITVNVRQETNAFEVLLSGNPQIIEFDSTKVRNLNCRNILIKNRLNERVVIDYIFLSQNLSFSLLPSQFPIIFEPLETKQFTICYYPNKFGKEVDTMTIFDRCWDQIFILIGFGIPENYYSESLCDVKVFGQTFQFSNSSHNFNELPFPNPSSGVVFVPLPMNANNISLKVFNVLGEQHNFQIEKLNIDGVNYFVLNLSSLYTGMYFIQIYSDEGLLQTYTVYLQR
jgi:photosystem II stability/assembly factor-like uncharacterized protein